MMEDFNISLSETNGSYRARKYKSKDFTTKLTFYLTDTKFYREEIETFFSLVENVEHL